MDMSYAEVTYGVSHSNVIHGRAANTTKVRIFPATTKIFNLTIFNAPFSLLLYINMPLSKEACIQMAITT